MAPPGARGLGSGRTDLSAFRWRAAAAPINVRESPTWRRFMMIRLFAMACALTASTALAQGDEPMPKPAPFPIEIVPRTTTVTVQPGGPFRWGTREVWQYYGVDSMGRWRPLVVREPFSTLSYF